jgi:hypothetical protein
MLCHFKKLPAASISQKMTARQEAECTLRLLGDLKLIAVHLPLDANEEIEMHAFGLEPAFQGFAGIGAKLDEHFAFEHVDEDTFGAGGAPGMHALGKSFSALAGEAGERVLGKVAWHQNS